MPAHLLISSLLCATLVLPGLAHAETKASQKEALDAIQVQIKETAKSLKRDKKALDAHLKQLAKIESELNVITRDLHKRSESLKGLQKKLSGMNQERHTLETKLAQQQQQLITQIKSAYMQGKQPGLKLLLNMQNAEHVSRVMKYYDYIHKTQVSTLDDIKLTLASLDTNENTMGQQRQSISQSKKALENRKHNMQKKLTERQDFVNKIQEKLKSKSLALEKLRGDESALEKVIAKQTKQQNKATILSAGSADLRSLKGKLTWPISGGVRHHFGEKIQNKLNWKGIVIDGQPGMSVSAPVAGQVVFADWMRGFGLLMIVDHGHGFLSLYGRNQVLYKQPGDRIDPGEVIGLVGTSGGFNKSGLYFEIRHHGLPVDPEEWLSKETA